MKNKTLQNFLIFTAVIIGSYATYKLIIRPAIQKLRTKKLTNFGNKDDIAETDIPTNYTDPNIIINSNSKDLT